MLILETAMLKRVIVKYVTLAAKSGNNKKPIRPVTTVRAVFRVKVLTPSIGGIRAENITATAENTAATISLKNSFIATLDKLLGKERKI